MDTMSDTAFRNDMDKVLDRVNENHKPVLITRQDGKPAAVLISLEAFQAYEEMAYLMANPKNAQRLNDAINQVSAGKATRRGLIEE